MSVCIAFRLGQAVINITLTSTTEISSNGSSVDRMLFPEEDLEYKRGMTPWSYQAKVI